jgi:hypothetical protein
MIVRKRWLTVSASVPFTFMVYAEPTEFRYNT